MAGVVRVGQGRWRFAFELSSLAWARSGRSGHQRSGVRALWSQSVDEPSRPFLTAGGATCNVAPFLIQVWCLGAALVLHTVPLPRVEAAATVIR